MHLLEHRHTIDVGFACGHLHTSVAETSSFGQRLHWLQCLKYLLLAPLQKMFANSILGLKGGNIKLLYFVSNVRLNMVIQSSFSFRKDTVS